MTCLPPICDFCAVRGDRRPKNGCFFGKFPKGGGVISDPKNYIADFVGFKAVYFGKKAQCNFQKGGRGGGSSPIQKISLQIYAYLTDFLEKKRNVISKKGRGGGGSRPFGSFPKKHPFLGRRSSLIMP